MSEVPLYGRKRGAGGSDSSKGDSTTDDTKSQTPSPPRDASPSPPRDDIGAIGKGPPRDAHEPAEVAQIPPWRILHSPLQRGGFASAT